VVNTYALSKNGDTTEGIAALSPREGQVLRLVADGRTSKQIAQHLVISPRTVEKHRARLMRKLGVNTIAALLTIAINSGFVEDAEACPLTCGGDSLSVSIDF
jgi:DNA-binding CsgD family transcriptional regulator